MLKTSLKSTYLSGLILLLIYGYILSLNLIAPLMADDYHYSFNWVTEERTTGFHDVLESQIEHYFSHGGRSVAHTFVQGFLYLGKPIFAFFNSFMFTFLIILIYWHSQGKITFNFEPMLLTLIAFLCWFCLPKFGETVIWLTGSCNYLWTTVFVLLFMLPYRLTFEGSAMFKDVNKIILLIGAFLFGIISGWTNENTAITMILATGLSVSYFYKKRMVEPWMIAGLIGSLIGCFMLIQAPGNFSRLGDVAQQANYSFLNNNLRSAFSTAFPLFVHQLLLLLLLFRIYKILRHYFAEQKSNMQEVFNQYRNIFVCSIVFFVMNVLNNFIMLASPSFPLRAAFASIVFLIIGVTGLLRLDFIHSQILTGKGKKIIIYLVCLAMLPTAYMTLQKHVALLREHNQRIDIMMSSKENGIYDFDFKPFHVKDRSILGHVYANDLTTESHSSRNRYYSKYFGVNSAKIVKEKQ